MRIFQVFQGLLLTAMSEGEYTFLCFITILTSPGVQTAARRAEWHPSGDHAGTLSLGKSAMNGWMISGK